MRDSEPIGNYAHVWSKYKPVIVKMMVDSTEQEQVYQLSNHEFIDVNPRRVTGYSFSVEIRRGRILAEPKGNLLLKDLMYVLKRSEKANTLMDARLFSLTLTKDFKLTVVSTEEE